MRKRPRYGAIPKSHIIDKPKPPKEKIPKAKNIIDSMEDVYVSNETLPLEILLKKALTLVRA
jgi:hypothetical protein